MLALRSCAYSMYTCIYAVANITIDPSLPSHTQSGKCTIECCTRLSRAAVPQ